MMSFQETSNTATAESMSSGTTWRAASLRKRAAAAAETVPVKVSMTAGGDLTKPANSQQVIPANLTPCQDPALNSILARLRKKNEDSVAHKRVVDGYMSLWAGDKAAADLSNTEAGVAERRVHSDVMTNMYYDMVTDLYEYGWGTSFHFARMYKDSTFKESITRHENYLAMRLELAPGMEVLDVGCGVGGPMREIARFSGASITGLNNNAYQAQRCNILAAKQGLASVAGAVKGDFERMPFPADSFDGVYAIEATCHARALENVYGEIFRVLKPGARFACYEWLTTDNYDENNMAHKKIVHTIEEGNAISKLYTIPQCLAALRTVGFEVMDYADMADPATFLSEACNPWYETLKGTYVPSIENLTRLPMSPIGRVITDKAVTVLEWAGIVPAGTRKVTALLNDAADNLVAGGEVQIFTPMFFFLARKPEAAGAAPATAA